LFFHREIVSLGALQNPRDEFELATKPAPGEKAPGAKPAPVKKAAAKKQTAAPRRPE
jgi:hypothetical protein